MSRHKSTVSIVVTNHNYEPFLDECFESLIKQSYPDELITIIMVDDASTDSSIEVMDKFQTECILHEHFREVTIVKLEENGGVAHASNVGLAHSTSDYYVRVDSDDVVKPDFIMRLVEELDRYPDINCCACNYTVSNFKDFPSINMDAKTFNISCGIMYRREALLSWGGYNEDYRHKEEEELRKRVGEDYRIWYTPNDLYTYHNKTKQQGYKDTVV